MAEKREPLVVTVGGGFAGVTGAKSLRGGDADVWLTDPRNHHSFQPLLYQIAPAMSVMPEARRDAAGMRYVYGE